MVIQQNQFIALASPNHLSGYTDIGFDTYLLNHISIR